MIGNMTADPEIKETGGGSKLAVFSIAINEFWGGEKQVSYFDVKAWGKTAEIIEKYTKKGSQIGIDGRNRQERWQDQAGNNRSKVVIIAEKIDLLSKPDKQNNQGNMSPQDFQNQYGGQEINNDLPF